MSTAVDKAIYPHSDRAERKRLAKELDKLRPNFDGLAELARSVRLRGLQGQPRWHILDNHYRQGENEALARSIEMPSPNVPVTLLACWQCGYPTPKCTCGLDWTTLS